MDHCRDFTHNEVNWVFWTSSLLTVCYQTQTRVGLKEDVINAGETLVFVFDALLFACVVQRDECARLQREKHYSPSDYANTLCILSSPCDTNTLQDFSMPSKLWRTQEHPCLSILWERQNKMHCHVTRSLRVSTNECLRFREFEQDFRRTSSIWEFRNEELCWL